MIDVYWDRLSDGRHGAHLRFVPEAGAPLPGVMIEDVLPEYAQDAVQSPERLASFIKVWQVFLAPQAHWDSLAKSAKGTTKDTPKQSTIPPVDLKHYGFIDAHGALQVEHVRAMITAIAPVWQNDPPLGLV